VDARAFAPANVALYALVVARNGDDARFMHRHSEHGYTSSLHEAMRDEPEAVSESEQRRLTRQAERRADDRKLAAWREARTSIMGALDTFTEQASVSRDHALVGVVRGIRHRVHAIDKRIGV
jgi:hypothetical protein